MNLRWTQRFDGNSVITSYDIEYKNKTGEQKSSLMIYFINVLQKESTLKVAVYSTLKIARLLVFVLFELLYLKLF